MTEKDASMQLSERPATSLDTEFFWDGLRKRELRIQRCGNCRSLRNPPRPSCASCGSLSWDWVISSGQGEIYSYSVVYHPPIPGRPVPHTVALVELDEGVRVLAPLLDIEPTEVVIGTPVEAVFLDEGDFVSLSVRPRAIETADHPDAAASTPR